MTYIPDLGLEYPDLEGWDEPPECNTIDWECSRSNSIIRAWDLRPSRTNQLLNYVEDGGSYPEQAVVYDSNVSWEDDHPYFDGTGKIDIMSAHKVRERTHRELFTFAITFRMDSGGGLQYLMGGWGGYFSMAVNNSDKIWIHSAKSTSILNSLATIEEDKVYRLVYVHDINNYTNANSATIFLNGVLDNEDDTAVSFNWYSTPFSLGHRYLGGYQWHGWIDYPVMWGRALSEAEVMADYRNFKAIYKPI